MKDAPDMAIGSPALIGPGPIAGLPAQSLPVGDDCHQQLRCGWPDGGQIMAAGSTSSAKAIRSNGASNQQCRPASAPADGPGLTYQAGSSNHTPF
jgi:hypothetical protein